MCYATCSMDRYPKCTWATQQLTLLRHRQISQQLLTRQIHVLLIIAHAHVKGFMLATHRNSDLFGNSEMEQDILAQHVEQDLPTPPLMKGANPTLKKMFKKKRRAHFP